MSYVEASDSKGPSDRGQCLVKISLVDVKFWGFFTMQLTCLVFTCPMFSTSTNSYRITVKRYFEYMVRIVMYSAAQ